MPLRKMLLRGMLWSLAFAAGTGVLAALFDAPDLIARVVGTGAASAIACALLMPISLWIDREKTRPAGLLGMTAVTIEFLLALLAIWEVPRHLFGFSVGEELGLTMLFLALGVILWMALFRLGFYRAAVLAMRAGLFVAGGTLFLYMLAIWLPGEFYEHDEWWITGNAIFLFGGLMVISLVVPSGASRRSWRLAAIPASAAAFAMWMSNVWLGTESDLGTVIFAVLISLAGVVDHASLCLLLKLPPPQRWVRRGTIITAVLTAALIDLIVIDEVLFDIPGDFNLLSRFASAAGIVTGSGSMALIVLARMHRKVDFAPLAPELNEMTVVCPRCRRKQQIALGDSSCPSCGLRIAIRIEEPSCPECGYLLYALTSDRCPECGTPISV